MQCQHDQTRKKRNILYRNVHRGWPCCSSTIRCGMARILRRRANEQRVSPGNPMKIVLLRARAAPGDVLRQEWKAIRNWRCNDRGALETKVAVFSDEFVPEQSAPTVALPMCCTVTTTMPRDQLKLILRPLGLDPLKLDPRAVRLTSSWFWVPSQSFSTSTRSHSSQGLVVTPVASSVCSAMSGIYGRML